MLRPGGKLLLRASLRAAGVRNDVTEQVIRASFARWTINSMQQTQIPSDTAFLTRSWSVSPPDTIWRLREESVKYRDEF